MYSTLDDLKKVLPEKRLLELADDTLVGEFVSGNEPHLIVSGAIDEADAIIDTYLADHYDTPLDQPHKIITVISAHLAVCALYERSHDLTAPVGLQKKRDRFMKILGDIKGGALRLGAEMRRHDIVVSKTVEDIEFSDELLSRM